jgi:peptidoglycan/LPS O-acetylase OafA/YrhL
VEDHDGQISHAASKPPRKRLHCLDGLRGIAALIVLFSHLTDTTPAFYALHRPMSIGDFFSSPLAILKYTPFRLLISGRAMVLIFFVLSGFVLCYSYRRDTKYGSYIIKRILRIYPPFMIAIFVSIALYLVVDPTPVAAASYWFNDMNWSTPPSPPFIASNLAMTGVPQWPTINNPTWSLIHEMRISIIFPLLVMAVRWRLMTSVILSILLGAGFLFFESPNPVILTIQLTAGYATFFVFGAALAIKADAIIDRLARLSRPVLALLWMITALLLIAPMNYDIQSFLPGFGAVLLISLIIASPTASGMLEGRSIQWLGRVSYSLYLIHVPILLTLVHLFGNHWPLFALSGMTVALSLISAEIFYRLFEMPSIWAGKVLARRWTSGARRTAMPLA